MTAKHSQIYDATETILGGLDTSHDEPFVISTVKSYVALRELSIQVAIFIAVKTDVDRDFSPGDYAYNEERLATAFDRLETAQANAVLALADEVKS